MPPPQSEATHTPKWVDDGSTETLKLEIQRRAIEKELAKKEEQAQQVLAVNDRYRQLEEARLRREEEQRRAEAEAEARAKVAEAQAINDKIRMAR